MNSLKRVLIWDLPTRLFHWLLAVGFSVAAILAMVAGEDSPLFPYHAMVGLTITLMVVLRVPWGFAGSPHARFSSFAFGPRAVATYMSGVVRGGGIRHTGHNPGSAWVIFGMLGLVLGLGATGLLLGQGNEGVKEFHEFLAYCTVAVVLLHVMGVALHTIRHRENITASMIHGRKDADVGAGIAAPHYVVAITFLVLSGAWAWALLANYDAATRTTRLPLIGASVHVGEAEVEGHSEQPEPQDGDD